jgi:hypothetical protein
MMCVENRNSGNSEKRMLRNISARQNRKQELIGYWTTQAVKGQTTRESGTQSRRPPPEVAGCQPRDTGGGLECRIGRIVRKAV